MTQKDKWAKRPAVLRYRAFCDELRWEARRNNYKIDEDKPLSLTFYIKIPKSTSKKKRIAMIGTPHKKRPDIDNLLKSFLDASLEEDSVIWWIGEMKKLWSETGRIEIHES